MLLLDIFSDEQKDFFGHRQESLSLISKYTPSGLQVVNATFITVCFRVPPPTIFTENKRNKKIVIQNIYFAFRAKHHSILSV